MGDSAFSIPTLLLIIPIAGAIASATMLTRRASFITAIVTALLQAAILIVAGLQLKTFGDKVGWGYIPSCEQTAASNKSHWVLAQCNDWFPTWGIQYHVAIGWGALGLIALTTLVTVMASSFSFWAKREHPAAIHSMLWLTAGALTGLFLSRDLMLFYVFFEMMLIPLLILVGRWGAELRVRATLTMFIYTLLGSLPMLVGVITVGMRAHEAILANAPRYGSASAFDLTVLAQMANDGTLKLSWWVMVSFLLAFAIKAPLIPLHGWMPLSYRQAPAEVAAMLSGVVSKAAYFGFLIIVLPLFPHLLQGGWGTLLTWVALASLIYGSLAAFRQPDPRGVMAYSSMAQMGLIILGLSAFLGVGGAQSVSGAYLQAINHGLISTGLFLLIGIVEIRTGEREFSKMGGLGKARPRFLTVALILTLIALAVPGATTFAGELLILSGVFRGDVSGPLVATIGCAAVVLAAMYALRLVAGMFMNDGENTPEHEEKSGLDLSFGELMLFVPILATLLLLSAWPNLTHNAMKQPPVEIRVTHDPMEPVRAVVPNKQELAKKAAAAAKEHK